MPWLTCSVWEMRKAAVVWRKEILLSELGCLKWHPDRMIGERYKPYI